MILQKMPHYVDSILTQEDASAALQDGQVVVGLYTNRENVQSVVHSHPYYEMILPVAGSSVRYSVDGSVYDLHLGELILFPGALLFTHHIRQAIESVATTDSVFVFMGATERLRQSLVLPMKR